MAIVVGNNNPGEFIGEGEASPECFKEVEEELEKKRSYGRH